MGAWCRGGSVSASDYRLLPHAGLSLLPARSRAERRGTQAAVRTPGTQRCGTGPLNGAKDLAGALRPLHQARSSATGYKQTC